MKLPKKPTKNTCFSRILIQTQNLKCFFRVSFDELFQNFAHLLHMISNKTFQNSKKFHKREFTVVDIREYVRTCRYSPVSQFDMLPLINHKSLKKSKEFTEGTKSQ